jgi:hypothetical protein
VIIVRCQVCGARAALHDAEDGGWIESADGRWRCAAHAEVEEIRGFDQPEDGSEERYVRRRQARPWAAHTTWWVVHNAVAHPLIAILPVRPLFQFHDWTSRKMHGR